MAVRVSRVSDDTLFEFSCTQWSLMTDATKADWTVTENTCGIQTTVGNPYAASDFIFTLNGVIAAAAPLSITVVDGVYTISITLPQWYTYKGVVSSNRVIVPTGDFLLPANDADCYAIVRRQIYLSPDDFTVNLVDNSLDFVAGPSLNGQTIFVRAFV